MHLSIFLRPSFIPFYLSLYSNHEKYLSRFIWLGCQSSLRIISIYWLKALRTHQFPFSENNFGLVYFHNYNIKETRKLVKLVYFMFSPCRSKSFNWASDTTCNIPPIPQCLYVLKGLRVVCFTITTKERSMLASFFLQRPFDENMPHQK